MEDVLVPIVVIPVIFLGLPWIIFHYITKWKTAATITNEDEHLLNELHAMARRLDDRLDTVERIIKADNPDWRPSRLTSAADQDDPAIARIEHALKGRNAR